MRASLVLVILMAIACQARADTAQSGDIEVGVSLDSGAQSGSVAATVRIRAPRELVWSLVTSCEVALKTVPGLSDCEVLDTAPDRSWQLIRHVIDYSWYLPRLTYEMRANYAYPTRVSIERVSGDLSVLEGSWYLESDGDCTVAHYSLHLVPGFWVPHWLMRAALRRDLPKMLRALRARAESAQ